MRQILLLPVLGTVLLISACTPAAPAPGQPTVADTPPPATVSGDSSQSPTPPPPTPSPSSSPSAADAITTSNVYGLCVDESRSYLAPGDPANAVFAPASNAISVDRDDGYVGIHIDVDDGNNPNGPEVSVECIVGGTTEIPDWYSVGASSRTDDQTEIEASLRAIHSA